jgi:hypothetical protein
MRQRLRNYVAGASSERMGAKSEFAFFKRPRGKLEKGKIRGNFPLKKPQKQKNEMRKIHKNKKTKAEQKTLLCLENLLKCKLN